MATQKPNSCSGCALAELGAGFTRVDGLGRAGVMIVGEASGEHEAREGVPFVQYAQAGGLLARTLKSVRMERDDFHLTNVIRCRPPKDFLEGAPWEYEATVQCRANLYEAIDDKKPKVLLALGNIPLKNLTGMIGKNQSISMLRGYPLPSIRHRRETCTKCCGEAAKKADCVFCAGVGTVAAQPIPDESVWVLPTFHPAFIRRGAANLIGVLAHDVKKAVLIAKHGFQRKPVEYMTKPSIDDAWNLYHRIKDNPQLLVTYDLETPNSSDQPEDERDDDPSYEIISIQFSIAPFSGWFFPWRGEYVEIATKILELPNPKAGQNIWNFDDPRIRAKGIKLAGLRHDTMNMFHHVQPDLPANLQFSSSFYGMDFPWKHLNESDPAFYGCVDVDAPQRMMLQLPDDLKRRGVWDSYMRHIVELHPILVKAQDTGLPINNEARLEMKVELEKVKAEYLGILRAAFPPEAMKIEPKTGYKVLPKKLKDAIANGGPFTGIETKTNDKGKVLEYPFTYVQQEFTEPGGDGFPVQVTRWVKRYEFNPASWKQIIVYMKAKGHPVPKDMKTEDETTAKKELERLAKKTGDKFYLNIIEYRSTDKMLGTYVLGFAPATDGRVHTTFTFAPGTGQLSSRNPNIQNIPKHSKLAKAFRKMIEAPPGHKLVEGDYSAFHVLTTGFEAEDKDYIRAARLDMHSILSGHVLKLHDARQLMEKSDEEIREYLKWYKSDPDRKFHRDKKAKPTILGVGFGLGERKLYDMNQESFESLKEAKAVREVLKGLYPKVFAWQDRIRETAHNQTYLLSKFSFIRWFFDVYHWDSKSRKMVPGDDAEAAIAFFPANDAFGVIRDAMLAMEERGFIDRYGFCNNIHDSLMFICPDPLVEECVYNSHSIMAAPSKVLTNSVAPDGLACGVEVQVGQSWDRLETVKIPQLAVVSA